MTPSEAGGTGDKRDKAMAARIKNCVLRANEVLINANTAKPIKARVPVSRRSFISTPKPKYSLKLSAKPMR